jgi:hypothetical protein
MRWLVLVFFPFFLLVGCDLNPQPEVPGSDEPQGAGGSAGATGASDDLETSKGTPTDPGPPVDFAPDADHGGLWGGASRPDGGAQRESPDAGANDAAATPPIVVQ